MKGNRTRQRTGRKTGKNTTLYWILGLIVLIIIVVIGVVQYNKTHIRATFNCSGSKSMKVVFNTGKNGWVDIKLSDGRKLKLDVTASAGGARYANVDESVVFWNVGNTATLDENGKTTFENCVTK